MNREVEGFKQAVQVAVFLHKPEYHLLLHNKIYKKLNQVLNLLENEPQTMKRL